jgi:hypothetical protein
MWGGSDGMSDPRTLPLPVVWTTQGYDDTDCPCCGERITVGDPIALCEDVWVCGTCGGEAS